MADDWQKYFVTSIVLMASPVVSLPCTVVHYSASVRCFATLFFAMLLLCGLSKQIARTVKQKKVCEKAY